MTLVEILNSVWLPVIFGVACLVYGVYMLITKDISKVRKKDDNRLLKDPEKYAVYAGYLFIFMAVGCIVMAILIRFVKNDLAATIQSLAWFVVFAVLWKMNDKKNGAD